MTNPPADRLATAAPRDGSGAAAAPHAVARAYPLTLVLVAYAALALASNLLTPVGESPDEPTHLEYVAYLQEHGRPPVLPPASEVGLQQAKHPPL